MATTSGVVHALGMGEIEINTSLNEPLDAKIKLFSATAEELDSLQVQMAPQDIFNRMGIERMPALRNLNFELVSKGKDAPYIKVSSSQPVKEPFLDFILSVNWASGQMMREYTLLLDPPVFEPDQQAGRISAAATEPAQVIREQAPAVAGQPRVSPPGSYGPTSRSDTLWAVAQKMRPDGSISVPQMMIALLKENPEAFEDGNINNLKAGYVLRQPDMDVITALSREQAAAESNRQYQAWLTGKDQAPAPAAAGRQQRVAAPAATADAPAAAKPPAAAAPRTESQARLQLLSPDEEARIRSGVGSGSAGESADALQRQLAMAQETAEATRQENADLRARLDELEKQLQSVQKLLTLRDDTLGALQAEAQQQPPAEIAAPAAEEQAEAPAGAEQPPVAAAPQPEPVEPSLLDEILANPTYLYAAGGGLLILLLLVMLIMRRRRQADEGDFTIMTPVSAAPETRTAAANSSAAAAPAAAAVTAAAASSAEAEPDTDVVIGDIGGLGTIHAEESEIDPIAEADVYLAYRRYEQAEALLKEAINADADRHELKLKLLEIYHATKDVDSFEAQAESLYAALGGQRHSLWDQAAEMGRELLPDHPLFSEGGATAADSGVDLGMESADEEFNFDDEQHPLSEDGADLSDDELAGSLAMGDVESAAADSETANRDEEFSLGDLGDLDLELDLAADTTEPRAADEEFALDELDLGTEGLEDIAGREPARDEHVYDLNDELDSSDKDALDLGAELEGFEGDSRQDEQPIELDEAEQSNVALDDIAAEEKKELSLAHDEGQLDDSENPYAKVDLGSFSTGESDTWQVEAAQSVFHSRDVESETDGLLDSARKKAESDNSIDLDEFSPATAEHDADVETSASRDATDSTVVAEEEAIDPLADISDLGEMDFGDLSDEDNDDIFDNSDDVVGTKLDLAKAYIDMGDQDGARSILDEVVEEGDDDQRQEAEQLMRQIS